MKNKKEKKDRSLWIAGIIALLLVALVVATVIGAQQRIQEHDEITGTRI